MKQRVHDWGTRLGDSMRAALADGDVESARRLALQGDDRARDLAREYTFMARGLGVTLDVLLHLLREAHARGAADAAGAGDARQASERDGDLAIVLRRLLQGLRDSVGDGRPPADAANVPARATVTELADAVGQALAASQVHFTTDQARRADDVALALAEGRTQDATALLDAKDRAWLALHDPLVRFMADAFAWMLGHFGAQGLLRFHLDTAEGQRTGFEKWERMPPDEFAATTAFLLRQHMGQVQVDEDERRFTIRQSPCGSGGRLRLGGAYAGPNALPFVEESGPLTFGEPRMPVYCTHCAIWNGSATLRWFGRAQWVFERPAQAEGSCTLHIYKRREDTPESYSRRVALPGAEETR
jgi:hypothetical protein